jgi:hypothetical protein
VTDTTLTEITAKYGKDTAGFIARAHKDWTAIQSAYSLPKDARIAGYEFVQSGALDHVFVDIVVGTGTTGIYDMKMLYQFERTEYKRKLIGLFIYDTATARYIAKSGANPFGGVARVFVRDPYFVGIVSLPATVTSASGTTTVISSSGTVMTLGNVSMAEISQAYTEKRYLTTISLSNTYLTTNKPTVELLSIRYRTYFIIGKYNESLTEIAKIESLGTLDRQTACNAQVIATYSRNQALVDKYAKVCKQ